MIWNLFFGVDKVSKIAHEKNKKLIPLIAVEVASGSGSHISKNANVTYVEKKQKKLISDDIITPQRAIFDYSTTITAPLDLTIDGALDGLAHSLEIYYGSMPIVSPPSSFAPLQHASITPASPPQTRTAPLFAISFPTS